VEVNEPGSHDKKRRVVLKYLRECEVQSGVEQFFGWLRPDETACEPAGCGARCYGKTWEADPCTVDERSWRIELAG